jgi:hypothetical protein
MKALIVLAIGLTILLLIVLEARNPDAFKHNKNETVAVVEPKAGNKPVSNVHFESESDKKLSVAVTDNFTATEIEIRCADLWRDFISRATPTENQQQIILAAIIDGRLNYEEERKVRTDELIQAAIENKESEILKSNQKTESINSILRGEVATVVKENLDSEQYHVFLKTFGNCIDSSVVAKIIHKK